MRVQTTTTTTATTTATVGKKDELAGVGLSFYKQIYVLKVPTNHGLRLNRATALATAAARPCSHHIRAHHHRSYRPLGRGTR